MVSRESTSIGTNSGLSILRTDGTPPPVTNPGTSVRRTDGTENATAQADLSPAQPVNSSIRPSSEASTAAALAAANQKDSLSQYLPMMMMFLSQLMKSGQQGLNQIAGRSGGGGVSGQGFNPGAVPGANRSDDPNKPYANFSNNVSALIKDPALYASFIGEANKKIPGGQAQIPTDNPSKENLTKAVELLGGDTMTALNTSLRANNYRELSSEDLMKDGGLIARAIDTQNPPQTQSEVASKSLLNVSIGDPS